MKTLLLTIIMMATPFLAFSQALYDNNDCGLNYAYAVASTSNRFTAAPGNGNSTILTISGIPECVQIDTAFLWWSGIGTSNDPTCLFNGVLVVGQGAGQINTPSSFRSYRADVTALITKDGNNTYTFSQPIGHDMDGVALMVVYKDPYASYDGHLFISTPGILRRPENTPPINLNFTTSGYANGHGILLLGGLESQNTGGHTDSLNDPLNFNGGAFTNDFYNFDTFPITLPSPPGPAFHKIVVPGGDAYTLVMRGMYTQSQNTCNPLTPMSIPYTPTIPLCNGNNNGQITVTPQGGLAPYTYSWSHDVTETNNTIANLTPGTYTVTVTDFNECSLDSTFTLTDPYTYETEITDATCAAPFGTASINNFAGGLGPYLFDWGTGPTPDSTATNLAPGTYPVIVTDANAICNTLITITIVGPSSPLTLNAGNDVTICDGESTTIAANASGGTAPYAYGWDNGLGVGQSFTVSPTSQTIYAAGVMDANGCTASDVVVINVLPALEVEAGADDSICPGASTSISATAVSGSGNGGPYTYNWNNGLGAGKSHQVSPTNDTTYIVTIEDGCSTPRIDSVRIYLHDLPTVDFITDTLSLCQTPQLPFQFTNLTVNTALAFWSFSDGATATGEVVSHTFNEIGSYDITLTVNYNTALGNCVDSLSKNAYIEVLENPTAYFTMNPNPTSLINTKINFYDQSYQNISNWIWDFAGLDTSTLQNPSYTFPMDTGSYWITLMVTDENGCSHLDSNFLVVRGDYGVFVPNAFTPDLDGLNDNFSPSGFGIGKTGYTFYIFNQSGNIIFKSNQLFAPWDGTYKGKLVEDGVYVWKLEFTDLHGLFHKEVGKVTILR